jgi:DNA polymerase III epsilon subunit-like protein
VKHDRLIPIMLESSCVVFLDCQTSGTQPSRGAPIELAWTFESFDAPFENAVTVESSLVALPPDRNWSKQTERITGISEAELENAPTAELIWERFLTQLNLNSPIAAIIHYARFELSFLRPLHQKLRSSETFPLDVVCTFELAKRLYPRLPAYGIRAVSGYLGWELPERRRAAEHVQATHFIWKKMRAEWSKQYPGAGWEDFRTWLKEGIKSKGRRKTFDYLVSRDERLAAPEGPGIYRMLSSQGSVLYIGKARSLRSRVNRYFQRGERSRGGISELMARTHGLSFTTTETATEAVLLESDEIKRCEPPYNQLLRRGEREVHYRSRSFDGFSTAPGPNFPFGPFSLHLFQRFDLLLKVLNEENEPCEIFEDETTPDEFDLALQTLFGEKPKSIRPIDLLSLARRLREVPTQPVKVDDEEIEIIFVDRLRAMLRRVPKKIRFSRWISRLSNCLVAWQEVKEGEKEKPWRYLILERSQIVARGDTEDPLFLEALAPKRSARKMTAIDITDYDRLRILSSELRRFATQGFPARLMLDTCLILNEADIGRHLSQFDHASAEDSSTDSESESGNGNESIPNSDE